ncbi:MAG: SMI1/KNR4 family protein [Treponema sp.]|nr:SMI1/KNR4 family protein [Treponema sp.]
MDWACYIPFEGDFDEIESFLGLSLPDDLKDVIKNYNKGCPLKSQFSYGDETDEIERFISFNRDGESNIYDYFVDDLQERKLLPFATTESDNILCLKNSKVIVYNAERDEETALCASVGELLQMLY